MDADRVAACATAAEARAARKAGFRTTAVVGIGASRGVPAGRIVSFGVAGGLDGLEVGTLIDATRIVAEDGTVLLEGKGLGLSGEAVSCSENISPTPPRARSS